MFDTMIRRGTRAARALVAGLSIGLALAGCGGEGAGAGGSAATSGSGSASSIDLFIDKPALPASDGTTFATVTAQVKDATNNVLRNQRVTFSSTDGGVSISPLGSSSSTDSSGRVQVRVDLGSSPTARSNRSVSISAAAGTATGSTALQVKGTTVTIAGPNSLTAGAQADYSIAVADGAGTAVAGLPLTVTFAGGTPASSTVTTGANGRAQVTLTGVTPGASDVVATATGLDPGRLTVNVLGIDTPFRVLSPSDGAEVTVNTDQTVVVQFRENGAPIAGRSIIVTTTRGTVNGASNATVVTNALGQASVLARSPSAGQGTISATVFAGGSPSTVTSRINYVSRSPSKISLSPEPTSIGANAAGSSSSTSRLTATVRDATDNPVKGALVTFSAQDPSNGSIQPPAAVTDASGQAVASFVAGPTSTGPQAVQVTATVFNGSGAAVASDTRAMTVSAVALFIELGTGREISAVDTTTYSMPWSAIVTDANRNPVPGARVTVSLAAINYFKGIWAWSGSAWDPRSFDNPSNPPLSCASEDLNRNNLLDAGEDVNTNGKLDPGSPASVRVTSTDSNTGADGRATLEVIYPRSFGEWAEVTMRVTIGTSGTESTVIRTFVLPVLGADVQAQNSAPPNVSARTPTSVTPAGALVGPYGYVQDCTNPN